MKPEIHSQTARSYQKASTPQITWLIAKRQMIEAIQDRSTLMISGIFLAIQTVLVLISIGPALGDHTVAGLQRASFMMAFYLLFVGLMPATPAIGIASGVFAGDKERGCLSPLLVTPASNTAILSGKVLGAVLPALAYAVIGILVYFAEIALLFGPGTLSLLPVTLSILILLLIPGIVLFGTALASVISSRVRTFQSAQTYSSLILAVLWIGLFGLLFLQGVLGLWAFALAAVGVYMIAALFIVLSAITWRREEVRARL